MRYCLLVVGALLASLSQATAQPDTSWVNSNQSKIRRAKAIYVEALGTSGLGLSINYDMRFTPGHDGWGFRVGSGQIVREGRFTSHSFPVLLTKISPNKRVAFERGGGLLITYRHWTWDTPSNKQEHHWRIYYQAAVNVGVRFQPMKVGPVWRVYWSPAWEFGTPRSNINLLWFGTSLGIGFN